MMPANDLITLKDRIARPHVVILGAGASLAAFPGGDANGRRVPVMKDLIATLELQDLIKRTGIRKYGDFERVYSRLHAKDASSPVLRELEARVEQYFGQLALPETPTLYDRLLQSVRAKDAIFTFNWDPFLADAYERNEGIAPLPPIYHLHGGVRIGFCEACRRPVPKSEFCILCENPTTPTRLLYPVEQKDYASDRFIATQWQALRHYLARAFLVTIFGYRAPRTDREAMNIFQSAWKGVDHDRLVDRIEIIDIRSRDELAAQWHPFSYYLHYDIRRSFDESYLGRYPRRSCEALYYQGVKGEFVEKIPAAGTFGGSACLAEELSRYEGTE